MKLHHLDIFNHFFIKDDIIFVLPELNNEMNFSKNNNYPLNKIIDGNYYKDIDFASDLIIIDKTFIEDVKNSDLHLIFTVAPENYFLNNPIIHTNMWDPKLCFKDLIFLGWTISSGTDTTIEDGIFPISIIHDKYQYVIDVNINDLDAIKSLGIDKK
ncbi:MAG: hypothetical protein CSA10_00135 [Cardiobacteriales bacterium]|nr:MAG: hypothetical protein CSA10_00135 [Cardiobacteriales bacterium]